ncbi:MAG TPA: DUF192 domain-containing protein [Bryobacteraceae bacterium]|nr:DUF192 domain-containing protein [Bryobacteraceae bacterium]
MRFVLLAGFLALAGCGPKPDPAEDFNTRPVTLPGGQVIRTETMIDQMDLLRGMMFRTSIAPDHGMLFVHTQPAHNKAWMYQTLIPLDMIWLDENHKIVEIVENAQPCKTPASQCPQYGGNQISLYTLEMGGGMAKRYGLHVGQIIEW